MARRLAIHPDNPQARLLNQAVEALRAGELWVYPTDSGYAFACALGAKSALERVIRLRQLDARHNFTLACRDLRQVAQYARVDDRAFRLLKSHLPGPYTFILPATAAVPKRVATERKRSIGVRIPDHRVAAALIEANAEPILSASLLIPDLDIHGLESEELYEQIEAHIDGFLDCGPCPGDPTTVVSLLDNALTVLRRGAGVVDWE